MIRKQNIGGTFGSTQRWSLNELGDHRIDASLFKAFFRDSLISQLVRNPPAIQETLVRFLGWEDPLEKG